MPEVLETTETVEPSESTPVTAETESQTTVTEPEPTESAPSTPREKMEKTVREKLDALNADEDEDDDSVQSSSDTAAAERPASQAKSEQAKDRTAAQEAAAEVTPAPTLPAAQIRSLKAFGLTDAEIATTSPQVAAALHARRNQEITRWADAGRQQKTPPVQAAQAVPSSATAAPATPAKPVDIAALRQTYGDEPLITVLETQQRELENFRVIREQWEAQAQQQKLDLLGKQVDQFFGDKAMSAYHAAYGTDSRTLTNEQVTERNKVLSLADAIVGGAQQSGVNLTLEQALQHAFDSISAPLAKETARKEIVKQLAPRAKGITLKPGGRPNLSANPKRELEKTVRGKMREIFS